jgi:mannose-6-phosphate isomerase-like protein (cupin superfamily)
MGLQRHRLADCEVLVKSGIQSRQVLWPKNAPQSQVTITHVVMEPGAVSRRHVHPRSEQIWIVEQGEGVLLLENGGIELLRAGDVVRTPAGETHGVENTGTAPLVYLAVTTPPQDFTYAYSSLLPASES